MKNGRNIFISCLTWLVIWSFSAPVSGQEEQDPFANQFMLIDIAEKLISYNDQLIELQKSVLESSEEDLLALDKHVATLDVKWTNYKDWNQAEIANNDSLLQIMADFVILKQELLDSIQVKKQFFEAEHTISEAEVLLFAHDSTYAEFYKKGLGYSMAEKLSPLLEKLKVEEQLLFADLEACYGKTKAIGAELPAFAARAEKLEQKFIDLKNSSEKIQALEYKPLFERIKNYLFGLASISMILMFISVVQSKIKVWRQNIENAKKYKEMMGQNNDDYPTI